MFEKLIPSATDHNHAALLLAKHSDTLTRDEIDACRAVIQYHWNAEPLPCVFTRHINKVYALYYSKLEPIT